MPAEPLRVVRTSTTNAFATGPGLLPVPDFAWERALATIRALGIPFETRPTSALRPREYSRDRDRWVVGIGANSRRTASYWAQILARTVVYVDDCGQLAALLERPAPSSLTLIIDRDLCDLDTLVSIHRLVSARAIPFGIIPVLDEATAAVAATKRILHAHAGWQPERRLIYSPGEARASVAAPGAEMVIGHLPMEEALKRLNVDLDLLCMLTHANGVDAYLGDGLFACANEAYRSNSSASLAQRGSADLLPCFGGADCNRGPGRLLHLRNLRVRVFALFSCGGILPTDGIFDIDRSLGAQLVENPWVEACFSSLGLFETWGSMLLTWSKDFLTQRSAGEAARATTKRFASLDQQGAELLILVGDPDATLRPLPALRVGDAQAVGNAVRMSVSLAAGPAVYICSVPPTLDLDGPLTTVYAAEPTLGIDSIRGHAVAEGHELTVLLGSEVPVASLPIVMTSPATIDVPQAADAVFRRLSTTKRYVSSAGGDHDLQAHAVHSIERVEQELLKAALVEIPLKRVGGAIDLREIAGREQAFETSLRTLHRSLLGWQEAFARARGSKMQKNWSHLLVEVNRVNLTEPCAYCRQPLTLARHSNPLEPGFERFLLTCRRCWHVGDFSYGGFPRTLHAPAQAGAGEEITLSLRFDHQGPEPLFVDAFFLFEDFHPGGPRSRASQAIQLYVSPGARMDLDGSLTTDPSLQAGRYVMSAHVMVNGGLNVLRRPIGIARRVERH